MLQPVIKNKFPLILLFITLITCYRLYFLWQNNYNLYADEAQYWDWSRNLAFGYYSKPPFIAWIIRFTTSLFGNSEFAIRFSSPILHAATSIVIYLLAVELTSNQKIALYSSITYITLPGVSLSASIMSTDSILLFFWSLTILLFVKSIRTNNIIYWLGAGGSLGCGLLTKYNMGLVVISSICYLIINKRLIDALKNYRLWLAISLAFLIYLPNLIWNYDHGFVSYAHTKEISRLDKSYLHPKQFLEFFGAQILIISPILFYIFAKSLKDMKTLLKQDIYKLLACYFLPILLLITLLSLIAKALGNWAVVSVVTIIIWCVIYQLEKNREKLLIISIILNIISSSLFYNFHNFRSVIKFDPSIRVHGWNELGQKLQLIAKKYPGTKFLVADRKLLVELLYYCKDSAIEFYKYNPSNAIHNHYDMTLMINKMKGEDFIYINAFEDSSLEKNFKQVNLIDNIYQNEKKSYKLYLVENFLGYIKN